MFRSMFRPDSPLMITFRQITDCIFLSLFWLIGCLPIVTAGASFAALYDSTFRGFRDGEEHPWRRFFQVYRTNWKTAIAPTAVFLGAFALLGKAMIRIWNAAVYGQISWTLFAAGAFVGMLALGILSILFPLMSRFDNSFGALLKNTLLLGLANMPMTLGLGFVNSVIVVLCIRFVLPVFFLPSLGALIGSLFLEPMFRPYMPAEEEADETQA